ncbi:hypothetical protein ABZW30_46380 [Kitasatospora sp. NPDC004669]|uniref:hypothetical protein n=1 Tax=Kitasatospora sp. NPDC004669 TaxID=3154555 RepID=UPI0033BB5EDB
MPSGDPEGGYASVDRMEELLGWRPTTSIEEGVARYVAWLRANPGAIPEWMRRAVAA